MLKATSENFPEHKMAANVRGKYTLRRKEPEPDETLDLNYGIDSDIDEESDEEDYQPLVQFILLNIMMMITHTILKLLQLQLLMQMLLMDGTILLGNKEIKTFLGLVILL